MKRQNKLLLLLLLLLLALSVFGCGKKAASAVPSPSPAIDLWTAPPTDVPTAEAPPVAAQAIETAAPVAEAPSASAAPAPSDTPRPSATPKPSDTPLPIDEDGVYTSKDDVALYLHVFGHLPSNFLTKKEAQALGWPGGNLEPYAPGMCIGGDRFGNRERLLPTQKGRTYYECDIDTLGARSRGAKRIIYSDDGWIYYTDDHYESFELLYGGD